MSLFTTADLHLSLSVDKTMTIFPGWEGYMRRIEENWRRVVKDGDTVVLIGDFSWAQRLTDAEADFDFVQRLPGRKLMIKGNHDLWWSTLHKMNTFLLEHGFDSMEFIHNSAARVGDIAVCGSRGWFFDAEEAADRKILSREANRLESSIRAALALGGEPVAFLHYPPIYNHAYCKEIMNVLTSYPIRRCYYGHIHCPTVPPAANCVFAGIRFQLVSSVCNSFCPILVPEYPAGADGE